MRTRRLAKRGGASRTAVTCTASLVVSGPESNPYSDSYLRSRVISVDRAAWIAFGEVFGR